MTAAAPTPHTCDNCGCRWRWSRSSLLLSVTACYCLLLPGWLQVALVEKQGYGRVAGSEAGLGGEERSEESDLSDSEEDEGR